MGPELFKRRAREARGILLHRNWFPSPSRGRIYFAAPEAMNDEPWLTDRRRVETECPPLRGQ
jgi:hypothetical protein